MNADRKAGCQEGEGTPFPLPKAMKSGRSVPDYLSEEPELVTLIDILADMGSALIAFSGGVDSSFLLKAAVLSRIAVTAVTGVSATMPEQDLIDAREIANALGVDHRIIETSEVESSDFAANPPDRCFYCKDHLFGALRGIAASTGSRFVLDGSNLDDLDDWRPGRKAAMKHGVRSPLIEAGIRKKDIRRLSRVLGLPTWNKPSSPCLSSRFPYGEPITTEALRRVEAAEKFLRSLGLTEFRVRYHREVARIELREDEIVKMIDPETRRVVAESFKALGFKFVCLDLESFRSGRLNG